MSCVPFRVISAMIGIIPLRPVLLVPQTLNTKHYISEPHSPGSEAFQLRSACFEGAARA